MTGTGFHTRNRDEKDIEDDVDIDGDDGFGDIQFTEGDVLPVPSSREEVDEDVDVEIEGNETSDVQRTQQTLRELIAEGRVVRNESGTEMDRTKAKMEEVLGLSETDKMDLAILAAKKRGDKASMITALENKIKQLVRLVYSIPSACLEEFLGVYARRTIDVATLSNMYRPIQ